MNNYSIYWINIGGKMKKNATSQEVAKLAGVSQSAVSRGFTKGACISSRTKLRVIEAA